LWKQSLGGSLGLDLDWAVLKNPAITTSLIFFSASCPALKTHKSKPFINSLLKMKTLFYKIPPNLPLPKGGTIPLFGKEGQGEIL
jgi:hypothetical protein